MRIKINKINYHVKHVPKNGDKSCQYLLSRLLIGALGIDCGGRVFWQRINYSTTSPSPSILSAAKEFNDYLKNYSAGCGVKEFIKLTVPSNRNFFSDILSEFSHFFIQKSLNSNVSAFVYLYRILERLSYSTPLLYSKKSRDYLSTFNDFKDLFSKGPTGEYGLFNKFLQQGSFIDGIVLDSGYLIDFSSSSDRVAYFNILKGLFDRFESQDQTLHQFQIKFRNVASFLVTIRNRFFHMRTGDGQPNIATKELGDPEKFFYIINDVICSFLAIVTLHVIADSVT